MIQIIAEVAGGHLGEIDKMIQLVELSGSTGANIVKFQFYNAEELCEKSHPDYELFKSLEFSDEQWSIIFEKARSCGLEVYADVFGDVSFDEATRAGVDGYKMHSSDLSNIPLLRKAAETGKTLLLGVGGRKRIEIYRSLKFLFENYPELKIVLMVGHQLFPTPVSEHSLEELRWFKEAYKDKGVEVGCADHIDGDLDEALFWPITTIGAGTTYVEKHITIDRKLKLEDYESALDPEKFKFMVDMIRKIEVSCEKYPRWTVGRDKYRLKTVKIPIVKDNVSKGNEVNWNSVNFVRPLSFSEPIDVHNWDKRETALDLESGVHINGLSVKGKVGILVNARSASTRLPKKALKEICGTPTILLLLERMKKCNKADQIIFCTTTREDDDELASIVANAGYEVFRGPNEDVAQRLYLAAKKYECDHIVRVTGDDILRDINLIDEGIESHLKNNADYTCMPELVYGCETEIISSRAMESIVERAAVSENTEYLSWYLDDSSCFIQNEIDVPNELKKPYRLTLDTSEDFELFKIIYEKFYTKGNPVDLKEAVEFLDSNPEVADINKQINPKLSRHDLNLDLKI